MIGRPVVAGISYLNSRPYFHPMIEGIVKTPFEVVLTTPARANDMLARGKAVAGLVSSVEWIARRDVSGPGGTIRIPGLEIASFGPVRSILLLSDKPWPEIEKVAATVESATSVKMLSALARLDHRTIEIHASEDPLAALAGNQCDGALLIGDAAILSSTSSWGRIDLGEMWRSKTGLPMVYAVFVVRLEHERLLDDLRQSVESALAWSRENLDAVVAPVAEVFRAAVPSFDIRDYLEQFDRARSRPDLDAGLKEFARLIAPSFE